LGVLIEKISPAQFGKTVDYTSGKIKTIGKFSMKYGKVDVRAKFPIGNGFWPAIWMLPEDIEACVEFNLGLNTNTVWIGNPRV
jgi:beta-glucanase (GH16 family)